MRAVDVAHLRRRLRAFIKREVESLNFTFDDSDDKLLHDSCLLHLAKELFVKGFFTEIANTEEVKEDGVVAGSLKSCFNFVAGGHAEPVPSNGATPLASSVQSSDYGKAFGPASMEKMLIGKLQVP